MSAQYQTLSKLRCLFLVYTKKLAARMYATQENLHVCLLIMSVRASSLRENLKFQQF